MNSKENLKKTGIHGEAIDMVMNCLEKAQRERLEWMKTRELNK